MARTIVVEDDLAERLESHLAEGETASEFIEELVSMYEADATFLRAGYSE